MQEPPMGTSYEDFEPYCKWRREQNRDIIEVHLPGFQRQQLKVQLSSKGILTITGERPSDEYKMKRSRFRKELPVSEDCEQEKISAKFTNGILYLVLPFATGASEDEKASGCTSLRSILERNKRVALEIAVAISMAVAVGAYVNKNCQCSHIWNFLSCT